MAQTQTLMTALRAAWLVLIGAWLISLLPALVWRPLEKRSGTPSSALERMAVNVVIGLTLLLVFLSSALNLSGASIGAASGVITVVLGFALQNIILDLFSGILLHLEKPFRLVNWVTVNTGGPTPVYGQVRNMNWRTTQLQTRDNDLVSIPNSVMAGATVNNHANPSMSSRLKLDFVLSAKLPTQQARAVMKAGAMRSAKDGLILDQPLPLVVVAGVEDYGIRYHVFFYVNLNMVPDPLALNSVAENVLSELEQAGIQLALRLDTTLIYPRHESSSDEVWKTFEHVEPPKLLSSTPPKSLPPVVGTILNVEDTRLIRESWDRAIPLGSRWPLCSTVTSSRSHHHCARCFARMRMYNVQSCSPCLTF
ncbi:MAG: mechanosensitive ion channel family protein [Janthinobacterium lividum]